MRATSVMAASHCTMSTFMSAKKLVSWLRMAYVFSMKRRTRPSLVEAEVSMAMTKSRMRRSSTYSNGSMSGRLP